MHTLSSRLFDLKQVISPSLTLFVDALHFLRLCLRSWQAHRHRLPGHLRVRARPILGGLHHDSQLAVA
jgi:hypothetical protein